MSDCVIVTKIDNSDWTLIAELKLLADQLGLLETDRIAYDLRCCLREV